MKNLILLVFFNLVSYSGITAKEQNSNSVKVNSVNITDECQPLPYLNQTSDNRRVLSVNNETFAKFLKQLDLKVAPGYEQDTELSNWIPTEEVIADLPFYLSGFDHEKRPIWILNYGKQKLRKYALGGKAKQDLFYKYYRYLALITFKSMAFVSTEEQPVQEYVLFADLEGLKPADLLDSKVIQWQLKVISDHRRWFDKYVGKMVFLNLNPVSEILLNLIRYLILRNLEKLDIYGTNKSFWVPKLLQMFPKKALPEKYGGCKKFEPITVI